MRLVENNSTSAAPVDVPPQVVAWLAGNLRAAGLTDDVAGTYAWLIATHGHVDDGLTLGRNWLALAAGWRPSTVAGELALAEAVEVANRGDVAVAA